MHNSSAGILGALGVWKSKHILFEKLSVNRVFLMFSCSIELSILQEQQTMQSSFAYMLVVLVLNKLIFDFLNLWTTTDQCTTVLLAYLFLWVCGKAKYHFKEIICELVFF